MTAQDNDAMQQRCRQHAEIAARHATRKNLDRQSAELKFIAQGLLLMYGPSVPSLDYGDARVLAVICARFAGDRIISRRLDQARAADLSEAQMAFLSAGPLDWIINRVATAHSRRTNEG